MDSTIGILRKGYGNFQEAFEKEQSDIITTRLLLRKTIVVRGEEAAEVFYDQEKFKRSGATPKRFQKTLFGQGGVQGLDGEAHLKRKDLFMQCMNRESIEQLQENFSALFRDYIQKWEQQEEVVLFKEVEEILTRASCAWVGIQLEEKEVKKRTRQLSRMIDSSGAVGLRHYKGRRARKKAEKWIMALVEEARSRNASEEKSILDRFSFYRENGELLNKRIVAVEILNLIRPIVAIARYITFSALALHEYPQYLERLQKDQGELSHMFVQEVRRFYPFFPFVAAVARKDFEWRGQDFGKGTRVLLDLYATNHDGRIWVNPTAFYAERFADWDESPFNFIPQGGGDHYHNHRCAGEWITIGITKVALELLVKEMEYQVPEQNLKVDLSRIPAIPKSRFRISEVKKL